MDSIAYKLNTQLPMLISGRDILILDPSGTYLPPYKGGKRTALRRKLSSFVRLVRLLISPVDRNLNREISGNTRTRSHHSSRYLTFPLRRQNTMVYVSSFGYRAIVQPMVFSRISDIV